MTAVDIHEPETLPTPTVRRSRRPAGVTSRRTKRGGAVLFIRPIPGFAVTLDLSLRGGGSAEPR